MRTRPHRVTSSSEASYERSERAYRRARPTGRLFQFSILPQYNGELHQLRHILNRRSDSQIAHIESSGGGGGGSGGGLSSFFSYCLDHH